MTSGSSPMTTTEGLPEVRRAIDREYRHSWIGLAPSGPRLVRIWSAIHPDHG